MQMKTIILNCFCLFCFFNSHLGCLILVRGLDIPLHNQIKFQSFIVFKNPKICVCIKQVSRCDFKD